MYKHIHYHQMTVLFQKRNTGVMVSQVVLWQYCCLMYSYRTYKIVGLCNLVFSLSVIYLYIFVHSKHADILIVLHLWFFLVILLLLLYTAE